MKLLHALIGIQCLLIVLLTVVILRSNNSVIPDKVKLDESDLKSIANYVQPQNGRLDIEPNITETQIRQIIRTELEDILSSSQTLNSQQNNQSQQVPVDDAALVEARDLVSETIDYYVSQGQISPVEMNLLQEKIARLDATHRKQMLAKLFTALNKGQIDGRL